MQVDVLTLFPEMFQALQYGIPEQAQKKQALLLQCHALRDFTDDPYQTVDDRPFGGGPGMVMKVEPIRRGLKHIKQTNPGKVIYLSPQGRVVDDNFLRQVAKEKAPLIFLCGRYEGVDQRILMHDVDEEWSVGDYILSGGELAAMVVIDAMTRFMPGVLGDMDSAESDSFANGLLDHPSYTRPECIDDQCVPSVLLSGDHKKIEIWRRQQALLQTRLKKPELFNKITLSSQDKVLLTE